MAQLVIGWGDLTPRLRHLVPWWVGMARSSKIYRISPNGEALMWSLNSAVRRSVDIDAWLGLESRLEELSINLARAGVDSESRGGYLGLLDGVAAYEMLIPENIANAEAIAPVYGWLYAETLHALGVIGERFGLGPPVMRIEGPREADNLEAPDRIANLEPRREAKSALYVSPRHRDRHRLHEVLSRVAEPVGEEGGWGLWVLKEGLSGSKVRKKDSVFSDFISMSSSVRLAEFAADSVLVLVSFEAERASGATRHANFDARCRVVEECGPFALSAIGLDQRRLWATFSWGPVGRLGKS